MSLEFVLIGSLSAPDLTMKTSRRKNLYGLLKNALSSIMEETFPFVELGVFYHVTQLLKGFSKPIRCCTRGHGLLVLYYSSEYFKQMRIKLI